jgi:putative ABC transport system permease protein
MLLRSLISPELIALGFRDLRAHKLRSFLTALGMIFGVGAVICMLSIGEGASAEQMEQIRLLGSENIIIRSLAPPQSAEASQANTRINEYGIKREDVRRIEQLPHVADVALMREVADTLLHGARRFDGHVIGTTRNLFDIINVSLARGRMLAPVDAQRKAKVCVIGHTVARELFAQIDPLGETLTVTSRATGPVPYTVVGILGEVQAAGTPKEGKGARNINREVFIPLETADRRYGDLQMKQSSGSREFKRVEYSDVYVHVDEQAHVLAVSEMLERLFAHGHTRADYEIEVPLALLQKAEQDRRLWQMVLGSIAGISLLVGGIGIMNIMLASVTERTREIGIRRALGAKQSHITAQFLIQTLILSVSGGIIGIIVGVGFARLVSLLADWPTIVPIWGVALSFLVSVGVGVTFGLYPARTASKLDPIVALRYE